MPGAESTRDGSDDDPSQGVERVLYLTTLRCKECGNGTTYAHEGPNTAIDQEAPWPENPVLCPECGTFYPDDLAVVIEEVANAKRVDPESQEAIL
ncbi:hypothetical protein [Halomarina rubra]|uniref:Small CPxCG-related zinc finger protein n=1 Tax=Halomarina rubra TaxID=2071873 RepID=A0ABD6B211_9EURY|nr:hypothetical protein [Halomarina rubra]